MLIATELSFPAALRSGYKVPADRCSIYDAIGRGKHSVVYKGRKKKSIQYYAIKSVEKTQKPRVLQEVVNIVLAMLTLHT